MDSTRGIYKAVKYGKISNADETDLEVEIERDTDLLVVDGHLVFHMGEKILRKI